MAELASIDGIRGIYSDYTSVTADTHLVPGSLAADYAFPSSFVWAHPVLLHVDRLFLPYPLIKASVYTASYTLDDGTTMPGSLGGKVVDHCRNVTFGIYAHGCVVGMMGVICFLNKRVFSDVADPGASTPDAAPDGSDMSDRMSAAPGGGDAPFRRSMAVLYDPASGQIVHTYKCVSLGGVRHRTKRQIEVAARETMRRMAAGRPLPRRVSLLHVDPDAVDPDRPYRVDPGRRTLVKVPVRKAPRQATPEPRPKKATRTRRPTTGRPTRRR